MFFTLNDVLGLLSGALLICLRITVFRSGLKAPEASLFLRTGILILGKKTVENKK